MKQRTLCIVVSALVLGPMSCRGEGKAEPPRTEDKSAAVASSAPQVAPAPAGDPEKGKALIEQFECNRCHDGTGFAPAQLDKHCVHCHQKIHDGTYDASSATLAKWQKNIVHFRDVPSLTAAGKRLRKEWIESFLLKPYDVRPAMLETMPRLGLSTTDARDIAAYLTRDVSSAPPVSMEGASVKHGAELFEAKGCKSCHAPLDAEERAKLEAPKAESVETRRAVALAPDLRFVRDRFKAPELLAWLVDPQAVKADTLMPKVPLAEGEARDLAAYLLEAPLGTLVQKPRRGRMPLLERRVTYEEVSKRVFRNTCWHCHAEPDYAIGDGGPGNTGGFGFRPRGVNLAEYDGIASGYLDEKGERRSSFSPMPDGTPRLVAAMLARQAEEEGKYDPVIRGMPLGLPALSSEEIQLVDTWIAQGRPQ